MEFHWVVNTISLPFKPSVLKADFYFTFRVPSTFKYLHSYVVYGMLIGTKIINCSTIQINYSSQINAADNTNTIRIFSVQQPPLGVLKILQNLTAYLNCLFWTAVWTALDAQTQNHADWEAYRSEHSALILSMHMLLPLEEAVSAVRMICYPMQIRDRPQLWKVK